MTGKKPYEDGEIRLLCRALLSVRAEEERRRFLEDLMTIRELQDLTQRMAVVRLLSEGKAYQEIMEKVSVSSTTISRVNRALNYGSGGYRLVLDRLPADEGEVGE